MSGFGGTTQSPVRMVVEFSERSEESIETTDNNGRSQSEVILVQQ